jgi:hypothetical protein
MSIARGPVTMTPMPPPEPPMPGPGPVPGPAPPEPPRPTPEPTPRPGPIDRWDDLEPMSWEDWFAKFDHEGLALLYQARQADGSDSTFNKLVSRD